ncbi:MAG TPA: RagB/SusD family nutrient uptake outer membrane protein [Niabella sp.]|nr:RagB/SusD family nutrient uptake outer membrane protein [Niabella sp.]
MKYTSFIRFSKLIVLVVLLASCAKKLDIFPKNDLTPEKVYANAEGYKSVLAKIYATLSITGNDGPAGNPDIGGGLDEGSQVAFIRGFFNAQELPTDEAVVAWNDQTIKDFHALKWTSADPFLKGLYARPIYNITLVNEYIREAADAKLSERGITGTDAEAIKKSKAEARFMRAFNYWVMMDLFGKSTFITEEDGVGSFMPGEISREDLFAYIESELKAIENELPAAKTAEYGRVDQGAAWALLARVYLNAGVYTGTQRNNDALTYAKKVIDAGYSLHGNYRELFMADNDVKGRNEFIFVINCDGAKTKAFGNTSFLIHAAAGADNDEFGANSGWAGYRATKGLADLFPDLTGSTDKRAMFTTSKYGTSPAQIVIDDISVFDNGLHVNKWRNIRTDGKPVNDVNREFSDIDFPIFRLPEMYLIYAEAALRGGAGGNNTTALGYINTLRTRAGATAISAGDLNLQFVLNERGRELYWEGHRRTDLIRYNLLTTGTYLWPWKGGIASGTAVNNRYNIYPIPAENLNSNTNLTQNLDY